MYLKDRQISVFHKSKQEVRRMRTTRFTAAVLAVLVTFTLLSACTFEQEAPIDAVEISAEETQLITTLKAEGKDELEIAEEQIALENEKETEPSAEESVVEDLSEEASVTKTTVSKEETKTDKVSSASQSKTSSGLTSPSVSTTACPTTGTTSTPKATAAATSTPKPTAKAQEPTAKSSEPTATPTTKPTATPTTAQNSYEYMSAIEKDCVKRINALRKQCAVEHKETFYVPVVIDSSLQEKAHIRCREIVDLFDHKSASGTDLPGEAIYRGTATSSSADIASKSIVNTWKNSRGHYALLLAGCIAGEGSCSSKNCGMGVMKCNNYYYCVFGTNGLNSGTAPSSGYTKPTNTPVPTATPVSEPPKSTNAPEPTSTPVPKATNTPVPTATSTPIPEIEI